MDENGKQKEPVNTPPIYWGESKPMQQLRMLIEKVATTDANILITGENGTGRKCLPAKFMLFPTADNKK